MSTALTRALAQEDNNDVDAYLSELKAARDACVQAGDYTRAQACADRIKEVHMRKAFLAQHALRHAAVRQRRQLDETHKTKLEDTRKIWKGRLRKYDQEVKVYLERLNHQLLADLQAEDAWICRELSTSTATTTASSTSSFLRERAELERALADLVSAERYGSATSVQKDMRKLSARERELSVGHMRCKRVSCLTNAAEQLRRERDAAVERTRRGREALLQERDTELQRIEAAHHRALIGLGEETDRLIHEATTRVEPKLIYQNPSSAPLLIIHEGKSEGRT